MSTACFEDFSTQDHQLFELLVSCHLDLRAFAARANQSISNSLRWLSQPHIASAIKVLRDFDMASLEAATLSTRLRCLPALHTLLARLATLTQSPDAAAKPITPNDLAFIRTLSLVARLCGYKPSCIPPALSTTTPTPPAVRGTTTAPSPATPTKTLLESTPASTPAPTPTPLHPKPLQPNPIPNPELPSDEEIQRILSEHLPADLIQEMNQNGLARDFYRIWKHNEASDTPLPTYSQDIPLQSPPAPSANAKSPAPTSRSPPARASPPSRVSGLLARVGATT